MEWQRTPSCLRYELEENLYMGWEGVQAKVWRQTREHVALRWPDMENKTGSPARQYVGREGEGAGCGGRAGGVRGQLSGEHVGTISISMKRVDLSVCYRYLMSFEPL
jgi:hypothetical protein